MSRALRKSKILFPCVSFSAHLLPNRDVISSISYTKMMTLFSQNLSSPLVGVWWSLLFISETPSCPEQKWHSLCCPQSPLLDILTNNLTLVVQIHGVLNMKIIKKIQAAALAGESRWTVAQSVGAPRRRGWGMNSGLFRLHMKGTLWVSCLPSLETG